MKKNNFILHVVLVVTVLFGISFAGFVFADDTSTSTDVVATSTDVTATTSDTIIDTSTSTATTTDISTATSTVPDPVSIILKVYSGDTVLFDGPETVSACAESPEVDAPITVNGKCAVEQSQLSNAWLWYDFDGDGKKTDGFLDQFGGVSSDYTNNYYWGWFSNLQYGSSSLNQHHLSSGDELLLTYNAHPLRISVSTSTATVGDQITFTAEEESTFNDTWSDMLWTPSQNVTITLGAQSCTTVSDGTCSIAVDTAGSFQAIGSKSLYVPSAPVSIVVSNQTSGGGGGQLQSQTFDNQHAIAYLQSVQSGDGSFADSNMYTDWAGIAYGAYGVTDSSRDSLISYMSAHAATSSLATDNERRAIALLALGQNPYSFSGTNYINAITQSFDGTQFGDPTLVSDDIFALIPLSASGYSASDDIVSKDIQFIISKQNSDGSWDENVDMTSAGVQALSIFSSVSGVSDALSKASTYLQTSQGLDGGWGNVSSSSWAIQAMNALGAHWIKNGKSPEDYLANIQAVDGAALANTESVQNRIWATSYAVPAGLAKPWTTIMHAVSKPAPVVVSGGESADTTKQNIVATTTVVVVPDVAIPVVATSSVPVVVASSSPVVVTITPEPSQEKSIPVIMSKKIYTQDTAVTPVVATSTETASSSLVANVVQNGIPTMGDKPLVVVGAIGGISLFGFFARKLFI